MEEGNGVMEPGSLEVMLPQQRCESGGGRRDLPGFGDRDVEERQCWSLVPVTKELGIQKESLPKFSLATYRRATTRSERMEEKKRAEHRAERERKTAAFTTPGLPPLAMAPPVDWEWFAKLYVPSDLRFRRLFPDDPAKRADAKDLHGEWRALLEYRWWVDRMIKHPHTDEARKQFYISLRKEVQNEQEDALERLNKLLVSTTTLAGFEFAHLDNDGSTSNLELRLQQGEWIGHWEQDEGVKAVYGWLLQKYPLSARWDMCRGRGCMSEDEWIEELKKRLRKDLGYLHRKGKVPTTSWRKYEYLKKAVQDEQEATVLLFEAIAPCSTEYEWLLT